MWDLPEKLVWIVPPDADSLPDGVHHASPNFHIRHMALPPLSRSSRWCGADPGPQVRGGTLMVFCAPLVGLYTAGHVSHTFGSSPGPIMRNVYQWVRTGQTF